MKGEKYIVIGISIVCVESETKRLVGIRIVVRESTPGLILTVVA